MFSVQNSALLFLTFISFYSNFAIAQCPSGTVNGTSNKFCYKPVNVHSTWYAADFDCRMQGGNLVTIDNAILTDILNGAGEENFPVGENTFWTGLSNILVPGRWQWMDGSNASYNNWGPNQPNTTSSGNLCASQHLDYVDWYSENCNQFKPYFCELPQSPSSSLSSPCPTYPNDPTSTNFTGQWFYLEFTNKCYLLMASHKTHPILFPSFDDSRALCQQYGADDLVVIDSFQENSIIGGYMTSFSLSADWDAADAATIGLSNLDGNGWKWVDGQSHTFSYWFNNSVAATPPNESGWGQIHFGNGDGYDNYWHLYGPDGGDAMFICQKKMGNM